jgi:hypothetical protein
MILMLHIMIALASVAYTTYLFFRPSVSKVKISYGLVGLTVASGTYLVLTNSVHMLRTCTTGLLYIAGVSLALVAVHRKLAATKQKQ